MLAISKPYRIFSLGLETARIWPPTTRPHAPSAGSGAGSGDMEVRSIHGWIRHTKQYFSRCLVGEINIVCDVDEIPWSDGSDPSGGRIHNPPTHNCRVFLSIQYSSVFLVYFCLNWIYCTVMYSTALYSMIIWSFVCLKTCLLWNWIKTWKTAVFYIK